MSSAAAVRRIDGVAAVAAALACLKCRLAIGARLHTL